MTSQKTYFFGFDYLRSAFSIFVVAWHNFIFGRPTYFHDYNINSFSPHIIDIIYFNLFVLSIPVFLQVSLVLYIPNRQSGGREYFTRRMIRLVSLYFFWSGLTLLFRHFILGLNIKSSFATYPTVLNTIMSGARSPFYYLFSLIVVTSLTELFIFFKSRTKYKNTLISVSFVLSLVVLMTSPHLFTRIGFGFSYWNPINFLPNVFAAFIMADLLKNRNRTLTVSVLFSIYLLFSVLEWTCIEYYIWSPYWGYIVPPFSRISLVLGAMFFVIMLGKVHRPSPRVISLVSSCSLGIYCFHSFIPTDQMWTILNVHPHPLGIVNCTIQLGGALILTLLCRKIPLLKRFV